MNSNWVFAIIAAWLASGLGQAAPLVSTIENVSFSPTKETLPGVTVAIEGTLPDSCYEILEASTAPRIHTERVIQIFVDTMYDNSSGCEHKPFPFVEILDLGHLMDGVYEVEVYEDGVLVLTKRLEITPAFYEGYRHFDIWPGPENFG